MDVSIISTICIAIICSLVFNYLSKLSKRAPLSLNSGDKLLKLPLFYGVTGIIGFTFGLAIIVYGLIDYDEENILPQLFIFLFIGGMSAILILQQWVIKTIMTDTELIKINAFGKERKIKWEEINSVKFNPFTLELKIKSEHCKIKCHYHLIGFPLLVEKLEQATGMSKAEMGILMV